MALQLWKLLGVGIKHQDGNAYENNPRKKGIPRFEKYAESGEFEARGEQQES